MPDGAASAVRRRTKRWPNYEAATLGLRNYWYPIFFTPELDEGKTRAEQVCGERIIFKRVDGKVYGIEDRCPHRGVQLSARPTCHSKNTISCWLHGFTIDVRDGNVVQVISEPGSAVINRVKVRHYPVEETCGLVWVWIGDADPLPIEDELPPTFLPYHLGETDQRPLSCGRVKMIGNWRIALESTADATHFYGHRTQQFMTEGFFAAPLALCPPLRPTVITRNEPGKPQSFTMVTEEFTPIFEAQVEDQIVRGATPVEMLAGVNGPTEKAGGGTNNEKEELMKERGGFVSTLLPATLMGGATLVEFYTPIDEDHHMLIITSPESRQVGELEFSLDPDKYGDVEREGFLNFDAFLRAKGHHAYTYEDWLYRESLYKADSTIIALRNFVEENARGFQTRDDYWSPLKDLGPEMEVLYPLPQIET